MKHGQLPLFEGNEVGASMFAISGKPASQTASLELYEEGVMVIRFKNDDVSHKWMDVAGTVRIHKISISQMVIIPPAQALQEWDRLVELDRENMEASMDVQERFGQLGD